MPKLPRRSESEQLSRRSSVNQNILNFSSDRDISSKRNSRWWKNLSDNTRRMSLLTNSQIHPDSYKVLNTDSTITEDQNSQWWRHLSENENVPSPSKVNLTGDKSAEDSTEKNLSESQSEEDDQIFTKKRLFASQEQHPRKSRYSKAFNLNSVKATEEQNAQEEKQNVKIEVFKNQLEDDKNIESPGSKAPKGSKKRRKTKSIFSKKLGKRKYSDAFNFTEPVATEESNKNRKVEKEDSANENISVTKESTVENLKEGLFKLNRKKKRYSQAFLNAVNDEPIEQISENQKDGKKNDSEDSSNNHDQTTETSKIVEKVSLFKDSFKRKNYSEAFAVSKSKVLQDNESSEEEINIDEIQTQKHPSFIGNRSVNVTNRNKTPQKEIRNQNEKITKSATKSKTSINQVLRSKMDDSETSEEEINIEEFNSQKTLEKSINATKGKKKLFKRNTRSKKYSEAFLSQDNKENENDEHEVEETKLDPSQHVQKSQTLRKGKDDSSDEENIEDIKTQKEAVDKNMNITKEMKKNILKRGTKSKISSEEILSQDNDNKEKENDEYEVDETKLDPSQRARKSQTLNKDEVDSSDGENIEVLKPQKEMKKTLFKRDTRSKKYSEVFLSPSSSKIIQEENSSHSEKENDNDTNQVSSYRGRQDLFKLQNKSRKYSQVFEVEDRDKENNQNEPMATEENAAIQKKESQTLNKDEDDSSYGENIEVLKTQKEMKKTLFKRDTRSKKYSEVFLRPSSSKIIQEENSSYSEKENDDNDTNQVSSYRGRQDLLQNKSRIYSQVFEVDDRNKENNQNEPMATEENAAIQRKESQTLNKDEDDSSYGENIEVLKTQKEMKKTLFKRDTRSKKYSEVFLRPSSSKIIQEENSSHSEKENDDDTNQVSSYHGRQDLFKLQNKSRKYSQVFEVEDRNKENNQNEPMATEENAAMQRKESFEKLNTKHSQAFMELISMQKEIEEERARTAKQINIENKYLEIHSNKAVNDIMEKEIESDDTKLSSISSIDIPAEIKHPLFRPKARKSLYSSKSVNKNDQSNIILDQDPQKNLEQVKIRRISSKRFSLRSTSPADSGISKFFEESLISSTKLFINPNEDGLEGSAKKKRGRPPKSSSVVQKNLDELVSDVQKSKDNTDVQKYNNDSFKKGRSKSKSLTIVPENSINATNNKIIYDNNNLGSEEQEAVQNKNISKKDPKFQFGTTATKIPNIHSDIKENNDLKPEEQIKNKHSTSKSERKSKSVTSVHSDSESNTSKNKIIVDNQDSKTIELVKNKSLIGDRESITKVRDNNETSESNKISIKKKRARSHKSTSSVSENLQDYVENIEPEKEIISTNKRNTQYQEIEIIPDDRDTELDEAVENKNTTAESGQISKVVSNIIEDFESGISEKEIPKNNKITKSNEKIIKKKRGRPPKSTSTIPENVVNTSEQVNSIVTILKKSLTRTDENETGANKFIETETQVRREKSSTRKSSVTSHELPAEDVSDNDMSEDKNEELDKLMKQKNIVSKIPKKLNRKDNVTPGNNNRKSSVTNKSKETSLNNTIILYSSDLDTSLNNPEYSREIPVEKAIINNVLNISTSNQKQSSRFSTERNYESKESLSNIITIHSSISRAQSSKLSGVNKNVENWLSKSIVEPAENVDENKNAEEFLTTLNLEPRKSKKLFSWRRGSKPEQSSTEDVLKRKQFLLAVKDKLREKQTKSQMEIPVKKITDYFSKLGKNEKLKPIPKKTNSIKKAPHPVCTARLVNGKPYYAKKLFRGKQWCTPRFYKYLQNKMKEEYDDDTINESEKIMKYIVNSVQVVIKSKKYLKEEVDNLKKELARHKIIATTYDFFCFCSDFLPAEYRDLVVPMTRLYTSEPSVPYNEKDVFKQIEF